MKCPTNLRKGLPDPVLLERTVDSFEETVLLQIWIGPHHDKTTLTPCESYVHPVVVP